MMTNDKNPPKLAEWLLAHMFSENGESTSAGDVREVYQDVRQEYGRCYAFGWYWLQTLFALPLFFENTIYWSAVMFKNYFKMAYRSLLRDKLSAIINIAVVSATRRLKEIGIRKVVGSNKGQLVRQFLSENLLLCFVALAIGGVLAEFIFLPGFNQILAVDGITLDLEYASNPALWGFFFALLILTGLGSGAYPAFYISAFKPVNIFRGKQQFGRKNRFMRILLACQFAFSFIAIFSGIVMTQNAQYQKTLDWGYDQAQTIVVPLQGANFVTLKNEISRNPDIVQIAGSQGHIGRASTMKVTTHLDKQYEIRNLGVGFDYLETLGLRLKNGRFFKREFSTDVLEAAVVNQTFVDRFGWDDAPGKNVEIDSTKYSIVGVVEDFHQDDFYTEIPPLLFRVAPEATFAFLSARVQAGRAMETEAYIKETWRRLFPDQPYQAFFQDSVFEGFFREITGHMQIMAFTAILGLILSCMGLFGLVSLSVAKRMKELSIRKVLGAPLSHVVRLLNKDFVWLLAVASIISAIYKYHITIDATPFMLAVGALFITAFLTASSQIFKVARTNPVEALRSE